MGRIIECRTYEVATRPDDRVLLVKYRAERWCGMILVDFKALTEGNDEISDRLTLGGSLDRTQVQEAIKRNLKWHGGRIEWIS